MIQIFNRAINVLFLNNIRTKKWFQISRVLHLHELRFSAQQPALEILPSDTNLLSSATRLMMVTMMIVMITMTMMKMMMVMMMTMMMVVDNDNGDEGGDGEGR